MPEETAPAWLVEEDGTAVLRGGHCAKCGTFAFPAQSYGCIKCGAYGESLQTRSIPTNGKLVTFAVVRTHAKHKVPFTLGDIQLNAGPVVRVQLSDAAEPVLGKRFVASVVEDENGSHLEFVEEVPSEDAR